jgi:hypothetical protein
MVVKVLMIGKRYIQQVDDAEARVASSVGGA